MKSLYISQAKNQYFDDIKKLKNVVLIFFTCQSDLELQVSNL